MSKLNIKTEKVIDVQDWDYLVVETYERPYCFQQQDGCKERQRVYLTVPTSGFDYENDTVQECVNGPERGVKFAAWLARDPKQKLEHSTNDYEWEVELWWHRNFYPDIEVVANDLHAQGLLPAGKYTIDIDW